MERFDKLFDKLNGGYICFIILIVNIVASIIEQVYYMPYNPSYSMFTNYISDMGAGPIETKVTITVSNTIAGILLLLLILYILRDLEKKEANKNLKRLILILGIIDSIALILLGFFLLDPATPVAYEIHRIAAIFYFGCISMTMLIYGYLEVTLPNFSKKLAIISIITGILALSFTTGFVIVEYTVVPRQAFVYFIEHMFFYAIFVWLIVHGIFYWKNR